MNRPSSPAGTFLFRIFPFLLLILGTLLFFLLASPKKDTGDTESAEADDTNTETDADTDASTTSGESDASKENTDHTSHTPDDEDVDDRETAVHRFLSSLLPFSSQRDSNKLYFSAADTQLALESSLEKADLRLQEATGSPLLSLYGGLILQNTGVGQSLLNTDGSLLAVADGYKPFYRRDTELRPVFEKGGYGYVFRDGSFHALGAYLPQAIRYDASSAELKKQSVTLTPYKDSATNLYGYKNADGSVAIKPTYLAAYKFGEEGLAVVQIAADGQIQIINQSGTALPIQGASGITVGNQAGNLKLYLPASFGEESLGMLQYSEGLLRVRCKVFSAADPTVILSDTDHLLDTKGNFFTLPADYTLKAYSCGVALLEKEGRYGYFHHSGNWITDPIYTRAEPFFGGLAVCGTTDTLGAIDTEGQVVIPPIFEHLTSLSEGRVLLYSPYSGWKLLHLAAL